MKRLFIGFLCTTALMLPIPIPIAAEDYVEELPSSVVNMLIPSNIDFVIDPFELAGRGQVYSEELPIINYGETDVLLTFTGLEVVFANDTDFEMLSESFSQTGFYDNKAIYLVLDFGRNDIPPVVIRDNEVTPSTSIMLYAGQGDTVCTLSLSGSVNPYPAKEWEDGDIRIQLIYEIEAVQHDEPEDKLMLSDAFSDEDVIMKEDELPPVTDAEADEEESILLEDDKENEPTVDDDGNISQELPPVTDAEIDEEESILPEDDKENEPTVDDDENISQEPPPVIEMETDEDETYDDEALSQHDETSAGEISQSDNIDDESGETE